MTTLRDLMFGMIITPNFPMDCDIYVKPTTDYDEINIPDGDSEAMISVEYVSERSGFVKWVPVAQLARFINDEKREPTGVMDLIGAFIKRTNFNYVATKKGKRPMSALLKTITTLYSDDEYPSGKSIFAIPEPDGQFRYSTDCRVAAIAPDGFALVATMQGVEAFWDDVTFDTETCDQVAQSFIDHVNENIRIKNQAALKKTYSVAIFGDQRPGQRSDKPMTLLRQVSLPEAEVCAAKLYKAQMDTWFGDIHSEGKIAAYWNNRVQDCRVWPNGEFTRIAIEDEAKTYSVVELDPNGTVIARVENQMNHRTASEALHSRYGHIISEFKARALAMLDAADSSDPIDLRDLYAHLAVHDENGKEVPALQPMTWKGD